MLWFGKVALCSCTEGSVLGGLGGSGVLSGRDLVEGPKLLEEDCEPLPLLLYSVAMGSCNLTLP